MLPFRRILFPVDFSESNRVMASQVKHMAAHFGARLTVLHAFEPPPTQYAGSGGTNFLWPDIEPIARGLLEDFLREHFGGVQLEACLKQGYPADVIREYVRQNGADLIMMPTSGAGLFERMILGSVTSRVLHDVSCAVWTGTHEHIAEREPEFPCRVVLACVGWDDEADVVIRGAAALAKSFGAKLTAVHAVALPSNSPQLDLTPYRQDLIQSATRFLRDAIARAEAVADPVIVEGNVPLAVRDEALKIGAGLVVVGRGHAQERIARLLSSLYSVIRESPCPVLSL